MGRTVPATQARILAAAGALAARAPAVAKGGARLVRTVFERYRRRRRRRDGLMLLSRLEPRLMKDCGLYREDIPAILDAYGRGERYVRRGDRPDGTARDG